MKGRLVYLCLEPLREGHASYTHATEIIKGLRRRRWKIDLFAPSYQEGRKLPGPIGRLRKILITQLRGWLESRRVDAIYIRAHYVAFPTTLFFKAMGRPIIQELNGPYSDLFLAWPWTHPFASLFRWLMRIQLRWADEVITNTPELKDWLQGEIGSKSITVVPNGANTDLFHPGAVAEEELPEPYVVFFGNLAPWQGIDTLLKAFEHPMWPKDIHLVVVGDGIEQSQVEAASKSNTKIIYLGRRPYNKVAGIVAGSLAGLSPKNNRSGHSRTGLSPLKVYETLACGVPVIVSDLPGQVEVVREHKCGIIVPFEAPAALAEAVSYLSANPLVRKEMGQRGREVIVREHSWDKRAADTETIIVRILEREE